jgi:Mg-chelatase subunit ChlD
VFVQQLHRAAAQRGRLDPVYQDLSDHWTQVLQRLYPVWALIGPGLSDPGHIEIHSRTVYLDSEALLGSRAAIAAGQLEQRAILRCFGVALHETLHAKHTKRWAIEHDIELSESDDPDDRQLGVDRRLLEEPRMEAHGVREFPRDSLRGRFVRRALQAAVTDVILPAFAAEMVTAGVAGLPVTRDLAARASVYLQARTHYGIVEPATLDPLRVVWRAVLGGDDLRALDDLYAKVIWIPDGELDRLDEAARAYRQIVGAPDPPPTSGGAGEAGGRADPAGDGGPGEDDGDQAGGGAAAGSLADALEQAIATARAGQIEQLDEDIDLGQVLEHAAASHERSSELGRGRGTGLPTGRLPDRGVDRPPYPDEVQHARRYATRLRQAITQGTRQIDKRTPGGRFDGRAYARGRAEQAAGRPLTTHPWRVTRRVSTPIQEPHVGLVIDTSGSMASYEYALGPIAWILTDGLRQIGGRCATALFGNSAALLADGTRPLPLVPGIRAGGGTAFAGDAIELVSERLEMTNPRRPRFVYVLSDGAWADTRAGTDRIRTLADLGVPTIHLSIGIEPLSVECDHVVVIADPSDVLDIIARDTVEALQARSRKVDVNGSRTMVPRHPVRTSRWLSVEPWRASSGPCSLRRNPVLPDPLRTCTAQRG